MEENKELVEIQKKIDEHIATIEDFYRKEELLDMAKSESAKRNGGCGVCWYCGSGRLCWGADFNYDEMFGEGEGIASTLTCLDCGAEALFSIRHDKEDEE